jgi:hydroxymethylglutaryl-CoA lyase
MAGVPPLPRSVEIVEVSPRDGLQAEDVVLSTEDKVQLIEQAVAAGVRRIEVCSFVNPARVPQMADAEAVLAALERSPATSDDVTYIGLVLNRRGLDRAVAAGMREVNAVVVCSDTFGQRNQGQTVDESLGSLAAIVEGAHAEGIRVSATVSVAFGCPYEGEVSVDRATDVARRAAATGADEVALADTIGVAVPTDVTARFEALAPLVGPTPLRAHFHNTRNTGLANAYAAVEAGVEVLDASLGGIGGCPFAPGATGNVATEDLIYLLERMGYRSGLDLDDAIGHARWLVGALGVPITGRVANVGGFPAAPEGTAA